jgi:hypothetical protein
VEEPWIDMYDPSGVSEISETLVSIERWATTGV